MDSSEHALTESIEEEQPTCSTPDYETTPSIPLVRPASRAWDRFPGVGDMVGAYELLERIGEGSIGRIFLAEHKKLRRRVALKMLRPELSDDPKFVKRFFAEARAVNAIAHENIVQITDFVESDDHPSFLIMELLDGETLRERMAGRPLPFVTARSIARQLASALEAAHRAGIIHRDVKPDNVFLMSKASGLHVKLLDFGIAKVSEHGRHGIERQTNVGDLVGTPYYMSPELARGWPASERSDVYAFGVLLYEMITGVHPFEGKTISEVLEQHKSSPPIPPRERSTHAADVPKSFEDLILRCLEKDPMLRIGSMSEVCACLERDDDGDEDGTLLQVPDVRPYANAMLAEIASDEAGTADLGGIPAAVTVTQGMSRRALAAWALGFSCVVAAVFALSRASRPKPEAPVVASEASRMAPRPVPVSVTAPIADTALPAEAAAAVPVPAPDPRSVEVAPPARAEVTPSAKAAAAEPPPPALERRPNEKVKRAAARRPSRPSGQRPTVSPAKSPMIEPGELPITNSETRNPFDD